MFLTKAACSKALADARLSPLLLWKGIWKVLFIHVDALQQKSDANENHTGLSFATCCLGRLYGSEKKSSHNQKANPPSPQIRKQPDVGKSIWGKIRTRPPPKPCFCSMCIYKSYFHNPKRSKPPAF